MLTSSKYLTREYPQHQVRGISWCAKIHYRTCTHATRFGITAGLPTPILNPNCRLREIGVYHYRGR